MQTPLHTQRVTRSSAPTKIRLAILATALCDALGGPAEFRPRFSFDFIAQMEPNDNFGLGAGVWTDDTSMALALARSIATFQAPNDDSGQSKEKSPKGGFDEADQLDAYYRWWQEGTLSATGRCFDIGNTIQRALSLYRDALRSAGADAPLRGSPIRRIGDALTPGASAAKAKAQEKRREAAAKALARIAENMSAPVFGGNGSLMRVVPVGLAFWKSGDDEVGELAQRSSEVTHPSGACREACAAWSTAVARVVRSAQEEDVAKTMTKLDLLHHFANFPYKIPALKKELSLEVPLPVGAEQDATALEAHYAAHHPLFRLVVETARAAASSSSASPDAAQDTLATQTLALLPPAAKLRSSGYVVHTIVAALYALLATTSFEAGALLVANMGDDADTVAAVYGGLAGAWYAEEDKTGVGAGFWTPRVRTWRDKLVRRDVIEEVAEELVAFAGSH